ncbi:MAG: SDR family NAD(P)-dependent oxidoreductase [Streptosporangiales bacterium]|nr:SDR family NAD(P)-dependent oxidoreductase [Streptosporangiales bacterium]
MTADAPTALVTGASSGIGQRTARLLADHGYRVFGTSRGDRADEPGVEMLRLDVRSDESVAGCIDEIRARADHLDVLVNNAGVLHEGFAEETPLADAAEVFDTNLFGIARVTNAVLPAMRARRRGRIVNVGSLAAWVGEPGEAFYAASKAALARYTEALHHEVLHLGVVVSLVEPGAFTTNVLDVATTTPGRIADYDGPRETARDTLHESLQRGGDPQQVAELILRIVRTRSPKLRYVAGRDGRWLPHLRTLLPQRVFDHLLRRSFHLPKAPADV